MTSKKKNISYAFFLFLILFFLSDAKLQCPKEEPMIKVNKRPDLCQCRLSNKQPSARIINGTIAKEGDVGFAAILYSADNPFKAKTFKPENIIGYSLCCTASILNERYFLTAAHCSYIISKRCFFLKSNRCYVGKLYFFCITDFVKDNSY